MPVPYWVVSAFFEKNGRKECRFFALHRILESGFALSSLLGLVGGKINRESVSWEIDQFTWRGCLRRTTSFRTTCMLCGMVLAPAPNWISSRCQHHHLLEQLYLLASKSEWHIRRPNRPRLTVRTVDRFWLLGHDPSLQADESTLWGTRTSAPSCTSKASPHLRPQWNGVWVKSDVACLQVKGISWIRRLKLVETEPSFSGLFWRRFCRSGGGST